jgi:hypothetical protein
MAGQEDKSTEEEEKKKGDEGVDYKKEAEDAQEQNKQMRVITWVGLGLNILLGTGKAFAGTVRLHRMREQSSCSCAGLTMCRAALCRVQMGNSQALVADAVHSFTDGISDVVTLWAIHMMQVWCQVLHTPAHVL